MVNSHNTIIQGLFVNILLRTMKMIDMDAMLEWHIQEEELSWDFMFNVFNFPKFAQVERSSLDTELILRLHEEHTYPPIFPITAEGLMVVF